MATIHDIIIETLESKYVLSFVDNWMIIEGEEFLPPEEKPLNPTNDDADVIDVIVAEIVDAVCSMLEGGDTESVLQTHSDESANTGLQDTVLTGGVVGEEDVPAEGKQEQREDTELERQKDPPATPVTSQSSRGRPRRIFAAAWRGVKSLLLCGCCRRE